MDQLDVTRWRKSSYSTGNGGNCVEIGQARPGIAIRDSKDPKGPRLSFKSEIWEAFAAKVKTTQKPL
jgi:Domain of unknown function (DUF397)